LGRGKGERGSMGAWERDVIPDAENDYSLCWESFGTNEPQGATQDGLRPRLVPGVPFSLRRSGTHRSFGNGLRREDVRARPSSGHRVKKSNERPVTHHESRVTHHELAFLVAGGERGTRSLLQTHVPFHETIRSCWSRKLWIERGRGALQPRT
jgi:hypothetical protein